MNPAESRDQRRIVMPGEKPKQQFKFAQYDVVIADVEAQIAELTTALKAIKRIRDLGVGVGVAVHVPASHPKYEPEGSSPSRADDSDIRSDAFFKLTIADATIKFLRKWADHTPQSTKSVIAALDRGGIKGKNYQTVYKVLTRRAKEKRDVVNVHGDWGLPEWYLENPKSDLTKQE
jgi:hypothetical protein